MRTSSIKVRLPRFHTFQWISPKFFRKCWHVPLFLPTIWTPHCLPNPGPLPTIVLLPQPLPPSSMPLVLSATTAIASPSHARADFLSASNSLTWQTALQMAALCSSHQIKALFSSSRAVSRCFERGGRGYNFWFWYKTHSLRPGRHVTQPRSSAIGNGHVLFKYSSTSYSWSG